LADIQLFTSIPPLISRTDAAGNEIGESYQAACVESWIDAGFAPTTINARAEHVDPRSRARRVTVERDASEITGKPHTYLGDFLATIAAQSDGPFALANADILVPASAGLAQKVASLRRGQMMISRRLNVSELGASGTPYFYGYDFFAAHSQDVTALTETHLIFGAPWWDHYFPLAMYLHGLQITQLTPQVIHLRHHHRWNSTTYRKLGERFVAEMRPLIGTGGYARRLGRILGSDLTERQAAAPAARRPHWKRLLDPENKRQFTLNRIGALNVAVIDHLAPPPPLPAGARTPLKLRIHAQVLRTGDSRDIF
jgi:hypothetical protein